MLLLTEQQTDKNWGTFGMSTKIPREQPTSECHSHTRDFRQETADRIQAPQCLDGRKCAAGLRPAKPAIIFSIL